MPSRVGTLGRSVHMSVRQKARWRFECAGTPQRSVHAVTVRTRASGADRQSGGLYAQGVRVWAEQSRRRWLRRAARPVRRVAQHALLKRRASASGAGAFDVPLSVPAACSVHAVCGARAFPLTSTRRISASGAPAARERCVQFLRSDAIRLQRSRPQRRSLPAPRASALREERPRAVWESLPSWPHYAFVGLRADFLQRLWACTLFECRKGFCTDLIPCC